MRLKIPLDWVEDQVLGLLAKEREKGTSREADLSLEEIERRLQPQCKAAHRLKAATTTPK